MDDVRTEEASALLDFLAGGEPKPADMPSIRAMMGALHRRAEAAEQRADSVEAALAAAQERVAQVRVDRAVIASAFVVMLPQRALLDVIGDTLRGCPEAMQLLLDDGMNRLSGDQDGSALQACIAEMLARMVSELQTGNRKA
jgi:hypothetical protein